MRNVASSLRLKALLVLLFLLLLSVTGYHSFTDEWTPPAKPDEQFEPQFYGAADSSDRRPVQRILFVGNSRTYFNNMPLMVFNMAVIQSAPFRYEVAMYALPGHTFEDHSQSARVRELLSQPWDYVVYQGASPENTNPLSSMSFLTYGVRLMQQTREVGAQSILLTAWAYAEDSYAFENEVYLKPDYLQYAADYQMYIDQHGVVPQDRPAPETFFPLDLEKHHFFIQRDYGELSARTHTPMVNVGQAFENLPVFAEQFPPLTSDGNHPSIQGSYLAAVMFHVCFSHIPASSIHYVPVGLSEDDAQTIRRFVDYAYPNGTCAIADEALK